MPEDIDIITILPKGFNLTSSDIQNSDENIRFLYLDDESLAQEIEKSDIQIVIIDKDIKNFTQDLYAKIEKESLSVYFNPIKINKISSFEVEALKNVQNLKHSIDNPKNFDLEKIKEDLESKIKEVKAKKEAELRPQIESTYLEAIKIKEYFSIKNMQIENLKGKKEIYFVGENGDGKTVLLQAIALALKGDKYSIFAEDYIKDIKDREVDPMDLSTKDSKYPNEYRNYKNVKNLFAYGISRNKYDSEISEVDGYSGIFETPLISIKLRKPQDLLRIKSTLIDDEFIPKVQNLMSDKFKIIKEEGEVYFQEIDAEIIPFTMLSEGYKSTLIWLCDLLSRLMENQPKVTELKKFQAIVLIDEVDLYLHPKWKYDFMNKLRKIFPNIQFIMTTHSLVTILGASEDAVFYKVYKENGETKITGQIDDISYYTSDILMSSPLFNMNTIKSRAFDEKESLSSDDYVYHRIHKKIKERINQTIAATDKDVDSWLDDAFDEEFGE